MNPERMNMDGVPMEYPCLEQSDGRTPMTPWISACIAKCRIKPHSDLIFMFRKRKSKANRRLQG